MGADGSIPSPSPRSTTPLPNLDRARHQLVQLVVDNAHVVLGFASVTLEVTRSPSSTTWAAGRAPDAVEQTRAVDLAQLVRPDPVRGAVRSAVQDGTAVAQVCNAHGEVVGVLVAHHNGAEVVERERVLLERLAGQVAATLEWTTRPDDDARTPATEATRALLRSAVTDLSPRSILDACAQAILAGFDVDRVWLRSRPHDGESAILPADGVTPEVPPAVEAMLGPTEDMLWSQQMVGLVSMTESFPAPSEGDDVEKVRQHLRAVGMESLIFVPAGFDTQCLGSVMLMRAPGGADWTPDELHAARELGRDVGGALLNSRLVQHEQQSVAFKQRLIATVAHEIQTPLTSLRLNVDLLEQLDADPSADTGATTAQRPVIMSTAEAASVRRAIQRAAGRISDIAQDLLVLSRMEQVDMEEVVVDVNRVVAEAVDLIGPKADQARVAFTVDLPATPVLVGGDPVELAILCTNLVDNAVKYSDSEGVVEVRVRDADAEVTVSVVDEGVGIREEDREHLFEEFFRSRDPSVASRPGTGLGLAIALRVAERHGGTIEVVSEHGSGSRFEVHLPRAPDVAALP